MALFKTKQAVKYEKKHLLGIQDLSFQKLFIFLTKANRSSNLIVRKIKS